MNDNQQWFSLVERSIPSCILKDNLHAPKLWEKEMCQEALGAKSYGVLYCTIPSRQFRTLRYIIVHLSSCTALLCCDRIVRYSTLRFLRPKPNVE